MINIFMFSIGNFFRFQSLISSHFKIQGNTIWNTISNAIKRTLVGAHMRLNTG